MDNFAFMGEMYVVDGKRMKLSRIVRKCRDMGFDGSDNTIWKHLRGGETRISELCRPIFESLSKARSDYVEKSRAECTSCMSEVDARRREIAERMKGEEE